jgi:hypothetical protein
MQFNERSRVMFKKILVPVDGSPTSLQAVSRAVALAKAFDGTVTAIYVIDPYPFTGVGTDFAYGQDQYLAAATAEAHDAIRVAREAIEASGVEVDTRVVEGARGLARHPRRGPRPGGRRHRHGLAWAPRHRETPRQCGAAGAVACPRAGDGGARLTFK